MRHGHTMRRTLMGGLLALLAFAACVSLPGAAKTGLGGPAMAQDGFAIDQFYDELAPYGEWVYHPRHSYVWLPRSVPEGWRPYTIGQWVSTEEYGWYWDSSEPFAWAVYHYGRWGYDQGYGWYWVPGDTWAPAWVQWRYGTDYVGWAPVGPSPYGGGYAYGAPAGYAPPPAEDSWVFVRQQHLTSNVVWSHVLPRVDVTIALSRTTYVNRPVYRNGRVYNYGMPRDRWSQITRQQIKPRKIHRGNRKAHPHDWNRRHGRDLYAYAPNVRKGVKPRRAPTKVHQRQSKAKAKHNGNYKGRAVTTQAPRYRGVPTARPRKAAAHPGVVYPGRPGPGWGVVNPKVRPKADGGNRKVYKPPHPSQSKAAKAKAAKAKAAKSKAAKSKAAKPKTAKARPANRNAAKSNAARSKAAKAKAARAKSPRAKAATVGTAKPRTAQAKAAKARPPKAKAAKARSANAKPGAGRGGRGSGGSGAGKGKKGGGGNRAAVCKANPGLPFCGRRG